MIRIYLYYLSLTPGLRNEFADHYHHIIINNLREYFDLDTFDSIYLGYSLSIMVVKKGGVENLKATRMIYKKEKDLEIIITLPDFDYKSDQYVDFIFEGVLMVLGDGFKDNLDYIKLKCESDIRGIEKA